MVRIYLDLCSLKRPFDDLSVDRVRLESEGVLSILSRASRDLELVHAAAHDLENRQNPVAWRAARVAALLGEIPRSEIPDSDTRRRIQDLVRLGFKPFDAFHLASAELSGARFFITCDDRLLAAARRHEGELRVRALDPLSFLEEVKP